MSGSRVHGTIARPSQLFTPRANRPRRPHDDLKLGLRNAARYYYYPGWHEPGTVAEFGFNKRAYEALPADLKRILDLATTAVQVHGFMDFHAKNVTAVERLRTESRARSIWSSSRRPMARKVYASFTELQAQLAPWDHVAQGAYHEFLKG